MTLLGKSVQMNARRTVSQLYETDSVGSSHLPKAPCSLIMRAWSGPAAGRCYDSETAFRHALKCGHAPETFQRGCMWERKCQSQWLPTFLRRFFLLAPFKCPKMFRVSPMRKHSRSTQQKSGRVYEVYTMRQTQKNISGWKRGAIHMKDASEDVN